MNHDFEMLRKLAPTNLPVPSQKRYQTVHDIFHQSDLVVEERERLERLYASLLKFCNAVTFQELWRGVSFPGLREDVSKLGSTFSEPSLSQAKAFHDLRGGTIFHLSVMEPPDIEMVMSLSNIRALAYDLAKFMRGLLPFLDPEKSQEEESSIQVHTMDSYLEPWRERVLVQSKHSARVRVTNDFHGSITCRCVETSALDRTLFNLSNNATRFTADSHIDLMTFRVADLTRWCVVNSVSEEQEAWLEDKLGTNGLALFRRGESRDSSGLGLESCTDVIGEVFGLPDKDALVSSGYIGASLVDRKFCAWFHWPIYRPGTDDPMCDCGVPGNP